MQRHLLYGCPPTYAAMSEHIAHNLYTRPTIALSPVRGARRRETPEVSNRKRSKSIVVRMQIIIIMRSPNYSVCACVVDR